MKKLLTLLGVLLLGAVSVFAQWDCTVEWSYDPGDLCQPANLPSVNYHIEITLTIYDVANGVQVTDPDPEPTNTEDITELDTYFNDEQCQVENYCSEGNHLKTPTFTVTAVVEFVNTSTSVTFCSATDSVENITCADFSDGVEIPVEFN